MKLAPVFFILASIGLMASCSSTKPARDVQPSGFLGADASLLRKGGEGEAPLMYRKMNVNWASYNKILLDPVTFWNAPGEDRSGISSSDKQMLVNYFHQLIYNALSKDFRMVPMPEPNTLRVKVAISKAEQSHVVLDVVSTVVPQLRVLSGLKNLVTGKPAFVGEAQIEYKITDAATGTLLAEGAADRVGGKTLNAEHFKSWGDVEEAFQFWVTHAVYKLCTLQGKPGCTMPA